MKHTLQKTITSSSIKSPHPVADSTGFSRVGRSSPSGRFAACSLLSLSIVLLCGCLGKSENEVVVYTALDKEFSESILDGFGAQSAVDVLPKYDKESNKTVGLAEEIINQKDRQRADVFWNNEILHTLRLKKLGLLEPYDCPEAENYPASFVSRDKDWYGFAARARVLLVNTDLLPDEADWPRSINDLADPVWKDRCTIARPLFGTSSTHAAVLFSQLGDEKAEQFYAAVSENAGIESGNKQVAINVSRGRYAFGLTDTDDAIIELEKGNPVAIVFPDQGADDRGTLLIPNTVAIIKNGPNRKNARKLIDYLLRGDTERTLAACPSAQIPLHKKVNETSRVEPDNLKVMNVDFEVAAEKWETARQILAQLFP